MSGFDGYGYCSIRNVEDKAEVYKPEAKELISLVPMTLGIASSIYR
jgi:hypothetical protein